MLLSFVEAGSFDALRQTLERSVAWDLAEADKLTEAGALPSGFPAFLGEALSALDKLDAYGRAHQLQPEVMLHVQAVRQRLQAAYTLHSAQERP